MGTRTTPFDSEPFVARLEELRARRGEIQEQLGRLVSSPLFRSSRHYPKLLRYVVEQTLEGRAAQIKERALGIAVFSRDPDYDTNLDPVVRTSACEVRKRIAQYYHEPGHEGELRIDLPSGSYVPEFHFAPDAPVAVEPVAAAPPVEQKTRGTAGSLGAVRAHPVLVVTILTVLALGAATAGLRSTRSVLEMFWGPVWNASDSVIVCMGGTPGLEAAQRALADSNPPSAGAPSADEVMRFDRVAYSDALTLGRLFSVMHAHGKKCDVRRGMALTLTDLRRGPAVLIGAFNNNWTMRLNKDLRYTFERDNNGMMRIRDRRNPAETRWSVDGREPYSRLTEDYAIVSREVDPLTEKIVVTVAGMTKDGTLAAGEFVTEERYLAQLPGRAPSGWEQKNVQVVLGTDLVNGVPGPPRILAAWVW
jgi:hypothetical protein